MLAKFKERALDELGDPDAPIGSRPWSLWLANEIRKTLYDKQQFGTRLRYLVETFKQYAAWQELGFLTWEDFCAKRLQVEPEKIEVEIVLRVQGRPAKDEKLDNYQVFSAEQMGGGTSADYLTARIARDRPDILAALRRGEYKSVRQAAIAAGIVTPKVRHSVPDDPSQAGRYLAERVDRAWMEQMIDAFYRHMEVAE